MNGVNDSNSRPLSADVLLGGGVPSYTKDGKEIVFAVLVVETADGSVDIMNKVDLAGGEVFEVNEQNLSRVYRLLCDAKSQIESIRILKLLADIGKSQ